MTKVTSLRGEKINESGANEAIVDLLCELLVSAQKGEIVGFAGVLVHPNNKITSCFHCNEQRHMLVAGTVYLQRDLTSEHKIPFDDPGA